MNFVFSGSDIHIWPQYRYRLFRILNDKGVDNQTSNPPANNASRIDLKRIASNLLFFLKSYTNRPDLHTNSFDGVLVSTGAGCVLENGVAFNRANDFFNHRKDQRLLNIYSSHKGSFWKKYRGYAYAFSDFLALNIHYRQKFFGNAMNEELSRPVDAFIEFLQQNAGINEQLNPADWSAIRNELIQFAVSIPAYKKYWTKLLKKWNPRYMVIEDGNYGGQSYLLKWANEAGIKTIEVQHGIFDVAYQYDESLLQNSEFIKYKPDFLLTYGKYWNEKAKVSSILFDIGYPYLEDKAKQLSLSAEEDAYLIMFVSQGKYTAQLIKIANELAMLTASTPFKIIFRLHPAEDHNGDEYAVLKNWNHLKISSGGDIYKVMSTSAHIVGSYSFMLFEASLFDKRSYIHKNDDSDKYIPSELGQGFNNAQELFMLIQEPGVSSKEISSNYFWTRNWQERFKKFESTYLV